MLCAELPPRIYESLKTLCCLANASEPLQAQEIASAASLPPAQTAKILQLMTWAGFVESRRGTKGGFWLIRPPDAIHVTDVDDFFAHRTRVHRPRKRDGFAKGPETGHCSLQKGIRADNRRRPSQSIWVRTKEVSPWEQDCVDPTA